MAEGNIMENRKFQNAYCVCMQVAKVLSSGSLCRSAERARELIEHTPLTFEEANFIASTTFWINTAGSVYIETPFMIDDDGYSDEEASFSIHRLTIGKTYKTGEVITFKGREFTRLEP